MSRRIVDIHNHMLLGLDDGAQAYEDSFEMAELSVQSGVTDVICTPHCFPSLYENYSGKGLTDSFSALKLKIERELPLKLHLGMEVMGCDSTIDDLQNGRLLTLADSEYLLIEFDFSESIDKTVYILEGITEQGIVPIIAHPERYYFVAQSPSVLFKWADMGCLMQCNKDSISGKFGLTVRQIALDMLKDRLYSFVASDAHSSLSRNPYLKYVYNFVEESFGSGYANELFCVNPARVIANNKIVLL